LKGAPFAQGAGAAGQTEVMPGLVGSLAAAEGAEDARKNRRPVLARLRCGRIGMHLGGRPTALAATEYVVVEAHRQVLRPIAGTAGNPANGRHGNELWPFPPRPLRLLLGQFWMAMQHWRRAMHLSVDRVQLIIVLNRKSRREEEKLTDSPTWLSTCPFSQPKRRYSDRIDEVVSAHLQEPVDC